MEYHISFEDHLAGMPAPAAPRYIRSIERRGRQNNFSDMSLLGGFSSRSQCRRVKQDNRKENFLRETKIRREMMVSPSSRISLTSNSSSSGSRWAREEPKKVFGEKILKPPVRGYSISVYRFRGYPPSPFADQFLKGYLEGPLGRWFQGMHLKLKR